MPERIGRLLTLVQFLIGFGRDCAASLRQQSATPLFQLTMQARFGTSDLARILIRIARGLKLAAALDAQLRRHAASGNDIPTSAERARVAPSNLGNRSTTNAGGRAAGRGAVFDNLPDDELPSEEQIAALIRRGKVGAIIEAICRDLGLVPSVVSQQQWKEVADVISTFGGKFIKMICDVMFRIQGCLTAALDARQPLSGETVRDLENAIFERPAPA